MFFGLRPSSQQDSLPHTSNYGYLDLSEDSSFAQSIWPIQHMAMRPFVGENSTVPEGEGHYSKPWSPSTLILPISVNVKDIQHPINIHEPP